MQANYVQRLRLTFGKDGPARFIGHLDLARTLERSFNRSRIPIAYTQGFNRRPRMSLAAALPLGFTSDCELADIWLEKEMEPAEAGEQMQEKMAPGIQVSAIEAVSLAAPSLQSVTKAAIYIVTLLDGVNELELQQRIRITMDADSLLCWRKRGKGETREYDLRPLIIELKVDKPLGNLTRLHMKLFLEPDKTGRPDEVLSALSLDPAAARFHRANMILSASPPV
jgi:radical SAM-linked protein